MNEVEIDYVRKILADECNHRFPMDTPVMNEFLNCLHPKHFKKKTVIIDYGQMDSNVYIVKNGITRLVYFDSVQERTFGFGLPGTLFTQMHCFWLGQPSFFQFAACTDCTVLWTTKNVFNSFIERSKEFSQWVLDRVLDQLCGLEIKLDRVNGQAYERFLSLIKIMPEVVRLVPDRIIASYLGITPAWMSQLKKKYAIEIEKISESTDIKPFSSKSI